MLLQKYKNFYNNILFKGVHVERQVVKFAFEVGNRIQSEALRDEQGKMLTLCLADKVLDALEGEDELKLTLQIYIKFPNYKSV